MRRRARPPPRGRRGPGPGAGGRPGSGLRGWSVGLACGVAGLGLLTALRGLAAAAGRPARAPLPWLEGRRGPQGGGLGSRGAGPPAVRPEPDRRTYRSAAVDGLVADLAPRLRPELGVLFSNTWPNTIDTTAVHVSPGGADAFVITGDIEALWLRDSTNQVLPYAGLARDDEALRDLFFGLLRRQARSILVDAYANAFNFDASTTSGQDHQGDDRRPPMQPQVFEGKWEVDSLAAFLRLARSCVEDLGAGPESGLFDATFLAAVAKVLDTFEEQQAGTVEELGGEAYLTGSYLFDLPYRFRYSWERTNKDTRLRKGRGAMAKRCGMIKSTFRPSDDATVLPFLVPSNAMAAVELEKVGGFLKGALGERVLGERAEALGREVRAAIEREAKVEVDGETVYAYEVDGFGNALHMDDANSPSLLALPFLGYVNATDPVYLATRRRILSGRTNPYFFESADFRGVGSPHTGPFKIWPLALVMQALTATDVAEIADVLRQLEAAAAETGLMHESFRADDPSDFTRAWFAWSNGMFGELVIKLEGDPQLSHLVLKRAEEEAQLLGRVPLP